LCNSQRSWGGGETGIPKIVAASRRVKKKKGGGLGVDQSEKNWVGKREGGDKGKIREGSGSWDKSATLQSGEKKAEKKRLNKTTISIKVSGRASGGLGQG